MPRAKLAEWKFAVEITTPGDSRVRETYSYSDDLMLNATGDAVKIIIERLAQRVAERAVEIGEAER